MRHVYRSTVSFEWILGGWREQLIGVYSQATCHRPHSVIELLQHDSVPICARAISRNLAHWLNLSVKLPLDECHSLLEQVGIPSRKCI